MTSCPSQNSFHPDDQISSKYVTPESIAVSPTNIYRPSLREAKVYDDWKVAKVNPIFKKYDRSDRGNYCPLSIQSVQSKMSSTLLLITSSLVISR